VLNAAYLYFSFDSADDTDVTVDIVDPPGDADSQYTNCEVVWAKRGGASWFPGVVRSAFMFYLRDLLNIESFGLTTLQ